MILNNSLSIWCNISLIIISIILFHLFVKYEVLKNKGNQLNPNVQLGTI